MALYSYKGSYPDSLPSRIRLEENDIGTTGDTVTSLEEKTQGELAELGFKLVEDPDTSGVVEGSTKIDWDGASFVTVDLTSEEKTAWDLEHPVLIDYTTFYQTYIQSTLCKAMRKAGGAWIVFLAESRVNLSEAKGQDEVPWECKDQIQRDIQIMALATELLKVSWNPLKTALLTARFDAEYDIPDEAYIKTNKYDLERDQVNYESWEWNESEESYLPPVPWPADSNKVLYGFDESAGEANCEGSPGVDYIWDESAYQSGDTPWIVDP